MLMKEDVRVGMYAGVVDANHDTKYQKLSKQ
jgi:hypothetical protein